MQIQTYTLNVHAQSHRRSYAHEYQSQFFCKIVTFSRCGIALGFRFETKLSLRKVLRAFYVNWFTHMH